MYLLSIISAMLGFLEKLTILEDGGLEKYSHEALLVNFTILVVLLLGIFVCLSCIVSPSDADAIDHEQQSGGYAQIM